jgi:hypothetical protein
MYAMQYEITLPADYDMGIIRERVATKGPLLDGFAGLGLKAYLIRERGTDGSPVNQYAPFYLWDAVDGMGRFLWGGGGFHGIVESFGRPAVHHWTGVADAPGPERAATPRTATRATEALAPDEDPGPAVQRALVALRERARKDGVHSTALAVDPQRWEIVHFTLWRDSSPPAAGTRYQVLHLSTGSAR